MPTLGNVRYEAPDVSRALAVALLERACRASPSITTPPGDAACALERPGKLWPAQVDARPTVASCCPTRSIMLADVVSVRVVPMPALRTQLIPRVSDALQIALLSACRLMYDALPDKGLLQTTSLQCSIRGGGELASSRFARKSLVSIGRGFFPS